MPANGKWDLIRRLNVKGLLQTRAKNKILEKNYLLLQSKQAISKVCLVRLLRSVGNLANISGAQQSSQVASMGITLHSMP